MTEMLVLCMNDDDLQFAYNLGVLLLTLALTKSSNSNLLFA